MPDQTFWVEYGISDGAGTGTSGDPWSLPDAFGNATTSGGNTTVNIKMPPGESDVYELDSPEGNVLGNGSTANNHRLEFVGHNNAVGDMDGPGDAFHQSPLDAHINGITRGSVVPINALMEPAASMISYGNREHLSFRNLHLTGNSSGDISLIFGTDSSADGISIHNLRFSSANVAIQPRGTLVHITDCLFENDFFGSQVTLSQITFGAIIEHCIFDIKPGVWGLRFPRYGTYVGNNIFINGDQGARDTREAIFRNNLFYKQTVACIESSTTFGVLDEEGNIFVPAGTDAHAVLLPAGGDSILRSDNSLAIPASGTWSLTGSEFGWYGTDNNEDLQGGNSQINIDPQMVDPDNKDYSLKAGSPALNAGPYTINGVRRHIGPEMLTAGQGKRGRSGTYANIGRTAI